MVRILSGAPIFSMTYLYFGIETKSFCLVFVSYIQSKSLEFATRERAKTQSDIGQFHATRHSGQILPFGDYPQLTSWTVKADLQN